MAPQSGRPAPGPALLWRVVYVVMLCQWAVSLDRMLDVEFAGGELSGWFRSPARSDTAIWAVSR